MSQAVDIGSMVQTSLSLLIFPSSVMLLFVTNKRIKAAHSTVRCLPLANIYLKAEKEALVHLLRNWHCNVRLIERNLFLSSNKNWFLVQIKQAKKQTNKMKVIRQTSELAKNQQINSTLHVFVTINSKSFLPSLFLCRLHFSILIQKPLCCKPSKQFESFVKISALHASYNNLLKKASKATFGKQFSPSFSRKNFHFSQGR